MNTYSVTNADQEIAGYRFRKPELLEEALTHSSARKSATIRRDPIGGSSRDSALIGRNSWNERLEFLGDSVLGLVISTALFSRDEQFKEGDLSRIRAALVNESFLAGLARRLNLGPKIRIGHGESKSGLQFQDSILADAMEAVIAAIYLDGGFPAAKSVVERLFEQELVGDVRHLIAHDYKTELQELIQGVYKQRPEYLLVDQSREQAGRIFTVVAGFNGVELGRGSGLSKKSASQEAARKALAADPLNRIKRSEGVES